MSNVNENENDDVTTDSNLLQRAKDSGLKVTSEGRIVLPGTLSDKAKSPKKETKKPKAPKAPKEPKAPAEPKTFKGISSKIFSSGDTLGNIITGLSTIKAVVERENISCPYKVSTYKTELRVAFDTCKASELITKFSEDEAETSVNIGLSVPDKKEFFAINIA